LLVLGNRPRDFIPGSYVQFLRIAGRELSDQIIDALEICGTVTEIVRELESKIKAHNLCQVDIVVFYGERSTETYPV
ncbi:MAG: transcriptional regulator, partial [Betaproteobacteria bacterium]|nr:transcriptional regulator [Betaproteobacteria bacterium]